VVHGGEAFAETALITDEVVKAIEAHVEVSTRRCRTTPTPPCPSARPHPR
jgi:hypothetical protein